MEEMRFAPPKAAVDDGAGRDVFVAPPEVMKMIRAAVVGGSISMVITLVVTLVAVAGSPVLGFGAANFIDVALIAGLTFGIWRRSRTCAVLMLLYFVASKILMMVEAGKPGGIVMGLLFAYLYVQGVRGTFEYQRLRKVWLARADAR